MSHSKCSCGIHHAIEKRYTAWPPRTWRDDFFEVVWMIGQIVGVLIVFGAVFAGVIAMALMQEPLR